MSICEEIDWPWVIAKLALRFHESTGRRPTWVRMPPGVYRKMAVRMYANRIPWLQSKLTSTGVLVTFEGMEVRRGYADEPLELGDL